MKACMFMVIQNTFMPGGGELHSQKKKDNEKNKNTKKNPQM